MPNKIRDSFGDVLVFILGVACLAALTVGIVVGTKVTSAGFEKEIAIVEGKLAAANTAIARARADLERERATVTAWTGLASYYSSAHHGKRTASGSVFDMNAHTAASMSLPFGTEVLVLDLENNTWTFTTIQDRGPHPRLGRAIDLSLAGARDLRMERRGVVPVMMMTLKPRASGGDRP